MDQVSGLSIGASSCLQPPIQRFRTTRMAVQAGRDPLDGMLRTTESDVTAADALRTVSFHEKRGGSKSTSRP